MFCLMMVSHVSGVLKDALIVCVMWVMVVVLMHDLSGVKVFPVLLWHHMVFGSRYMS